MVSVQAGAADIIIYCIPTDNTTNSNHGYNTFIFERPYTDALTGCPDLVADFLILLGFLNGLSADIMETTGCDSLLWEIHVVSVHMQ